MKIEQTIIDLTHLPQDAKLFLISECIVAVFVYVIINEVFFNK